jgi:hypothetical protein
VKLWHPGDPVLPTVGKCWRPAVAWPTDLAQEDRHFSSGVNNPGEVRGLALSGRHFGITATEIRPGLLAEVELTGGGLTEIFVDSGAFSEVEFNPATGRLEIVRPIKHEGWIERFELYMLIAGWYGTRARVVAPDCVGNQELTLERLARYALHVAACASMRAQIIVPVQKGALPMSEMYRRACEILGLRVPPIAGIPLKKDATSLKDLAELVDSMPWFDCRFHLLGLGPESKRFKKVIECIRSRRPNAEITSDSVTIRRLVGRKNGRGGGPRPLTRYQDEGRARGLKSTADVKSYGLQRQGRDQMDAELDRAHAAGWFDEELFDAVEESIAHFAAIRAERAVPVAEPAADLEEAA